VHSGSLAQPWAPTTCSCLTEWRRYVKPFHTGTTSFAGLNGVGQACANVSKHAACVRHDASTCPQVCPEPGDL
jgi:hypothetical protein